MIKFIANFRYFVNAFSIYLRSHVHFLERAILFLKGLSYLVEIGPSDSYAEKFKQC